MIFKEVPRSHFILAEGPCDGAGGWTSAEVKDPLGGRTSAELVRPP